MEDKLQELVDRLRKTQRDRLVSVILYGSAATGNHHGEFSDLNVLCVLTRVTPAELAEAEPIFKWWRAQGNPSPLLLSEEEVRDSTDCFPIEFHDMQERRRVLFGADVVETLVIDKTFYRAQVEMELRTKLLRLRQKAGAVISDKQALLRLMIDSVPNFLVLSRHALLVSGLPAGLQKREIARELAKIGADAAAFDTLLDLREQKKKAGDVDPEALFANYLRQIETVVAHVDRLEK
ncbi:MAG TPA: nucleotidyltransferase domain-containing protein [Bryobacteraceae bacterium]|jgi:predicted nucleotidyltransferase|nr:nucleotidyltransferase domain-containing protein [Bryobacteraceae bacterium]